MSGLGERGSRLRDVARRLDPPPEVPPFYVQSPDQETRAIGWYMRWTRGGEPVYLGHAAAAAEVYLLQLAADARKEPDRRVRKRVTARSSA